MPRSDQATAPPLGQTVLLRLYGPMSEHADSVITPLLVPDTPVVTWWHGLIRAAPAGQPLGALAQRRVTDAAQARVPAAHSPRSPPATSQATPT